MSVEAVALPGQRPLRVWGLSSQPREARGHSRQRQEGLGAKPSVLGDFCNFLRILQELCDFLRFLQEQLPPEARRSGGEAPSAGRLLQFFHFCAYFSQNKCLKQYSVTHQLKAFEKQSKRTTLNIINEVQVL